MQHNGFLPAYLIRESNIINNATGLESFVEWMPEIKAARETYYKEYYRYVKEWENEFEGLKKAYQIKEDDIQKLLTYTAELEKIYVKRKRIFRSYLNTQRRWKSRRKERTGYRRDESLYPGT